MRFFIKDALNYAVQTNDKITITTSGVKKHYAIERKNLLLLTRFQNDKRILIRDNILNKPEREFVMQMLKLNRKI